ncbi:nitrate- and nitrite sensing domain-containing protein [Phorcysia thermohydrogeniphila]|uniref:Nitrate/nitrite sensing protein n=1 Tax=Phorcysia thermohydrogeniphila TaxID=936138 RepID=A0A4R1GBC3_9BACT|nr:nitrate- and nitrite sensing domain-containing protein [Phorcysia thermohydrogeniphila]TCK05294.1 nitrate/nitrite sensing protein [Phorcysia thermohydrogeniphila]
MASPQDAKGRITVLTVVPLIVVLIFAYFLISESFKQVKSAESLEKGIILSTKISAVVHELQKERGRSAGFLGSGGKEFKEELREQRLLTDKAISELKAVVDKEYLAALPEETRRVIERVVSDELNSVSEIRNKVDRKEITLKEAVSFYTRLNNELIDAIGEIAKVSDNAGITRELAAYADFLYAKEKMGLERAILSVAFARDRFDLSLFKRFVNLLAQQKAFIKSFELVAPDNVVEYYRKTVVSSTPAGEVSKLERLALSSPFDGGFNVDPNYWFGVITDKIDLMKKVEDYISRDLISRVDVVKESSKGKLMMAIVLSAISVVVVLGIRLTMGRSSEG